MMQFRYRVKLGTEHHTVRLFVSPGEGLTAQLTGVLRLSPKQYEAFKALTQPSHERTSTVQFIEEKENQ